MNNLKRLLILSNAPFDTTGYGRQTKYLCRIFKELGYEVGVVANHGLTGAAIRWQDIPIFPQRNDRFCLDVIGDYVQFFNADAVLSLYDLWHFPHDTQQRMGVPWIAWVPVEGHPIKGYLAKLLRTASYVLTHSEFGRHEVEAAGIDNEMIPLAVDTSVFTPGDRVAAREDLGFPLDRYVVTMVAMNKGAQPYRKGWPEMMQAWKIFLRDNPDALFYAHTNREPIAPGYDAGFWFDPIIEELHIPRGTVAFPDKMGFNVGIEDEEVAKIYRASDMVVLPSWAEGFGLPVIESQACGVPIVAHHCSAMPELVSNGITITRGTPWWMPERSYWWYRPRPMSISIAMNDVRFLRRDAELAQKANDTGVQYVQEKYSLEAVTALWDKYLHKVGSELW